MNDQQHLSLTDEIELYGTAIEALMHRLSKQAVTPIVKFTVACRDGEWEIDAEDADTRHDPTNEFAGMSGDHCWAGKGKTVAQAIASMMQIY